MSSSSNFPRPAPDLCDTVVALRAGLASVSGLMADSLNAADSAANAHAYIRRFDAQARAVAAATDAAVGAGAPLPPLAGLAVSIKDLFDVAGQPTTGGSKAMADALAAEHDCPAVARLRAAGAALTGAVACGTASGATQPASTKIASTEHARI